MSVSESFLDMFNDVMKDDLFMSLKDKELIALGIAIAEGCQPCIKTHIEKCIKAGAVRNEMVGAAEVAVVMRGGPAFMQLDYVARTIDRLLENQNV